MSEKEQRECAARQFELRKKVVSLKKEGKLNKEIATILGINSAHISTIWQRYLKGGLAAIAIQKPGRKEGKLKHLEGFQVAELLKIILMTCPEDYGISSKLWTRAHVKKIIERKFKKTVPLRTVSDYFAKWGLVPDKPIKKEESEDNNLYNRWLKSYAKLVKRAKIENFNIYWVDSRYIEISKNKYAYVLYAKSNSGIIKFDIISGELTKEKFVKFIEKVIYDNNKKVYLIIYSKEVYQSDSLHKWLDARKCKVEIEWLEDCYNSIAAKLK